MDANPAISTPLQWQSQTLTYSRAGEEERSGTTHEIVKDFKEPGRPEFTSPFSVIWMSLPSQYSQFLYFPMPSWYKWSHSHSMEEALTPVSHLGRLFYKVCVMLKLQWEYMRRGRVELSTVPGTNWDCMPNVHKNVWIVFTLSRKSRNMWKEEKEGRRAGGPKASSIHLDEQKLTPDKVVCMGTQECEELWPKVLVWAHILCLS